MPHDAWYKEKNSFLFVWLWLTNVASFTVSFRNCIHCKWSLLVPVEWWCVVASVWQSVVILPRWWWASAHQSRSRVGICNLQTVQHLVPVFRGLYSVYQCSLILVWDWIWLWSEFTSSRNLHWKMLAESHPKQCVTLGRILVLIQLIRPEG